MADKKVLSFEIGSQKIRICEVDYMKKNPHIYKCVTFDTPEGCVEDGYIKDKNMLVSAVKAQMETLKVKNRSAVFTIASTKIANREVLIPQVKSNMIKSVIDVSAMDYFPVDISEYTISYKVLERINNNEDKKLRLLLLAAPNYLIKNYHEFAGLLNLGVVSLDYAGNSTFQLMKKQVSEGVSLVVQISEQTSLINIIDNEMLVLQRTIPFGTSSVVNAMIDSGHFKFESEKDAIKSLMNDELINTNFEVSAEETAISMASTHESYDRIFKELKGKEEVTNSIKYLVNNVNRVVDYYNSKFPERKINVVYLTGQGAKFKGIGHLFQNEIGIELKKIENLFSVVFGNRANVNLKDQAEYLSCIGAAIDPVGFIMKDYLLKQQKRSSVISMGIIFVLSIVTSLVLGLFSMVTLTIEKNHNKDYTREIEELQSVNEVFARYDVAQSNYDKIVRVDESTTNRNIELNSFIEELEDKMPVDLVVTSLTANSEEIMFGIQANTKDAIARMIVELKSFESVDKVGVSAIAEEEDQDGLITVTCTISCKYKSMEKKGETDNEE